MQDAHDAYMLKITFPHIVYEKDCELDETSDRIPKIKRRLEWLSHVIKKKR
jgi:hypothetical protein